MIENKKNIRLINKKILKKLNIIEDK